jgi:hypothetical protein
MDNIINVLKIIFLIVAILVGISLLGVLYFVFMGLKSGDLNNYVKKTAIETAVDEEKLSPIQREMLESGDIDGLVQDLQENVTQEQIDCAVGVLGPVRAQELMESQNPTPQEVLQLSKCL